MTPVKPTPAPVVRAPRKAFFSIREGWLIVDPNGDSTMTRFRLDAINSYEVRKSEIVLSGSGFSAMLRPEQFSDAEFDDERREMVKRFGTMLDIYFSLNVKIEASSSTQTVDSASFQPEPTIATPEETEV